MASNYYIRCFLKNEHEDSFDEDVAFMQTCLQSMKEPFSYANACIISARSHRYYRDDGLLKVIDPKTDAGDVWFARLLSVVSAALSLLDGRGMVLRWGCDEFLVLFELPMDAAYKLCRDFCKKVESGHLVTVSVGLTDVRLADSIKKNYYRAAALEGG